MTTVALRVKNPQKPSQIIEADFLVDSGAAYTVLPQALVKKLDLKPSFKQEFILADGRKVTRNISSAFIEYQGREVASPVVLGRERDSLLLGSLTLEALGLILNPFERKLYPAKLMM